MIDFALDQTTSQSLVNTTAQVFVDKFGAYELGNKDHVQCAMALTTIWGADHDVSTSLAGREKAEAIIQNTKAYKRIGCLSPKHP